MVLVVRDLRSMLHNKLLYITGGLFLVYAVSKGLKVARGIRNNNAGNLRITSDKWQGLSEEQTDKEFFQFVEPVYGIRAMSRVLINYEKKYGIKTLRGIISRYAPSSENNTDSYIDAVAKDLSFDSSNEFFDIGPDDNFSAELNIIPLVKAIIKHENGFNPYDDELILQGVGMALA